MDGLSTTIVDPLHQSFSDLLSVLDNAGEVSFRTVTDENFRRLLLLAVASYFEHRMTESVLTFVKSATNGNVLVATVVRNKAVSRQYSTWFQWDVRNANSFFGLFRSDVRNFMERKV